MVLKIMWSFCSVVIPKQEGIYQYLPQKYLKVIEYKLFPSIFPHVQFMLDYVLLHSMAIFACRCAFQSFFFFLTVYILIAQYFILIHTYAHLGPFPTTTYARGKTQRRSYINEIEKGRRKTEAATTRRASQESMPLCYVF